MNRNDLCFCGSGKKYKKCHIGIHSESMMARLIKIENHIDDKVSEYYSNKEDKPPCHKGCNSCCYDYFTVSNIELYRIFLALSTWDKNDIEKLKDKCKNYTQLFKTSHPDIYYNLEKEVDSNLISEDMNTITKTDFPCVFLDENNSCMIYESRPLVCRLHGYVYPAKANEDIYSDNIFICEKIGSRKDSKSWQPNLELLDMDINFKVIDLTDIGGKLCYQKTYPLFYILHEELSYQDVNRRLKGNSPLFDTSEKELKEILHNMSMATGVSAKFKL